MHPGSERGRTLRAAAAAGRPHHPPPASGRRRADPSRSAPVPDSSDRQRDHAGRRPRDPHDRCPPPVARRRHRALPTRGRRHNRRSRRLPPAPGARVARRRGHGPRPHLPHRPVGTRLPRNRASGLCRRHAIPDTAMAPHRRRRTAIGRCGVVRTTYDPCRPLLNMQQWWPRWRSGRRDRAGPCFRCRLCRAGAGRGRARTHAGENPVRTTGAIASQPVSPNGSALPAAEQLSPLARREIPE